MALSIPYIQERYKNVLRQDLTVEQAGAFTNLTEAAFDNILLDLANVRVDPIIRLYGAVFDRVPETFVTDPNLTDGLTYWVNQYNSGLGTPLVHLLEEWEGLPGGEWLTTFDGLQAVDIIAKVYEQILQRDPDPAGSAYWQQQYLDYISSGGTEGFSLYEIIARIADSPEYRANSNAAIDAFLLSVADGNEYDGSQSLWSFVPDPSGSTYNLTELADNQPPFSNLGKNDRVVGDSSSLENKGNTYTHNDHIEGKVGNNNVFDLSLNGKNITTSAIVKGIDVVNINHNGSAETTLVVKNWTDIGTINVDKIANHFLIEDIQSGKTQFNLTDNSNNPSTLVTLDYDSHAGSSPIESNIGVKEFYGKIKVQTDDQQNAPVETINLTINDTKGFDSKVADLEGFGTTTLNIKGGYEGGTFEIVGALDGTLKTLDASKAVSNLILRATEDNRSALNAKLGSGNDKFYVGNELHSKDVFDGGAGNDTLYVRFGGEGAKTFEGTPIPTITSFETIDIAFNSNRSLDFAKIEGTKKVVVQESSNPFRLLNLANDVKTIDVNGPQANSYHNIYYRNQQTHNTLALNWTNTADKDDGSWHPSYVNGPQFKTLNAYVSDDAGSLGFKNLHELTFTHNGDYGTIFTDRSPDITDDAWQFDINLSLNQTPALQKLTVKNEGNGDLVLLQQNFSYQYDSVLVEGSPNSDFAPVSLQSSYDSPVQYYGKSGYFLLPYADIGGTNAVTDIHLSTASTGNIILRDIRNTTSLQNLTLEAFGPTGDIILNNIGFSGIFGGFYNPVGHDNPSPFNAALDLREVNLTAKNASVANINFINALANLSSPNVSNGATINNINLTAEANSTVNLWNLAAGDVSNTQIKIGNGANVGVDTWLLSNAVADGSSHGKVVASGSGTLVEGSQHGFLAGKYWDFAAQSIATLDFRGLTNDAVHVDFSNDTDGVTFYGTNGVDHGKKGWVGELSYNYFGNPSDVDVGNNSGQDNVYKINNAGFANSVAVWRDHGGVDDVAYTIDLSKATGDWVIGGLEDDIIDLRGGNDFAYGGGGHNEIYARSGTNYIVTGLIGTNEIWAGTGQDFIFLNNAVRAAGNVSAPNLINDFTTGQDKLIIDISDVEAKAGANLVWTSDLDLNAPFNEYRAAEYITINSATNVSNFGATIVALDRQGNFQDYTDVLTAIQANGDLEISTNWNSQFGNVPNANYQSQFEIGDALTIAWHDTNGNLHISLAKVTTLQGSEVLDKQTYNFEIHEVAELVGQSSWINWQNDLIFTA
ncbi:hypothetical protein ACUSIJ_02680 [Pseudochelatococcus sp. B33]